MRGNSGSGKSSVARALRQRYGYGMAWVEQDYLRRVLLREHDVPHGKNIDLNVRYAMEQGYHVVLEGILSTRHYGPMLRRLRQGCGTASHFYFFDLPFEETVRRHATRPQAREFGVETMHGWYQECDLLPFVAERVIPADSSLEATVERLWNEVGLQRRHGPDEDGP
nr:AAA family ATPase [Deinococcus aestuarii]